MKKLAAWFISKFEGDKGFSGGEIKFLIIIFLVMLTALTILYVFYGLSLSSRFDFLSYLMPCLAGILAGAGLFFGYERKEIPHQDEVGREGENVPFEEGAKPGRAPKSALIVSNSGRMGSEKKFYAASVLALYWGVFFYALSHRTCQSSAVLICGLANVVGSVGVLIWRIPRGSRDESGAGGFFSGLTFTLVILTIVFTIGIIIYIWPDLFIHIGSVSICADQSG